MVDKSGRADDPGVGEKPHGKHSVGFVGGRRATDNAWSISPRSNEGDEAEVVAVWRLASHLEEILGLCE